MKFNWCNKDVLEKLMELKNGKATTAAVKKYLSENYNKDVAETTIRRHLPKEAPASKAENDIVYIFYIYI